MQFQSNNTNTKASGKYITIIVNPGVCNIIGNDHGNQWCPSGVSIRNFKCISHFL